MKLKAHNILILVVTILCSNFMFAPPPGPPPPPPPNLPIDNSLVFLFIVGLLYVFLRYRSALQK